MDRSTHLTVEGGLERGIGRPIPSSLYLQTEREHLLIHLGAPAEMEAVCSQLAERYRVPCQPVPIWKVGWPLGDDSVLHELKLALREEARPASPAGQPAPGRRPSLSLPVEGRRAFTFAPPREG